MHVVIGLAIVMFATYASAQAPVDVTGTWVGSTGDAATMTLVLKQSGSNVSGTIVGAGTADGAVVGNVDGNTIRLRFDNATEEWPLMNVKGNEISGMLRGTTLLLRRQSP